ncbi:MAG: hypothetical protein GX861_00605 [Tenericutes bacterium]|jgi:hypothetical protein|nr:hypothetical protein [Mycoplasmatota bacterium]
MKQLRKSLINGMLINQDMIKEIEEQMYLEIMNKKESKNKIKIKGGRQNDKR